jgi:hypothetical protein
MIRMLVSLALLVCATGSLAAGPDVCAIVPANSVAGIVHMPVVGTRADVSEESHAYGCSYGASSPHISISVIRPNGAAAFDATQRRLTKASPASGIADKAIYEADMGLIVLFGDTAVSAFVPPSFGTSEQRLLIEKELVTAAKSKL